jgi:hypothetical protein
MTKRLRMHLCTLNFSLLLLGLYVNADSLFFEPALFDA